MAALCLTVQSSLAMPLRLPRAVTHPYSVLTLSYNPTDRQRRPLNAVVIDVFSLYHLQLSFEWFVTRVERKKLRRVSAPTYNPFPEDWVPITP